jgi:hypothetical protein
VLLLSANLEARRFASALRALRPNAVVLCGTEASLDIVGGPLRRALRDGESVRILGYRTAQLVAGTRGTALLGDMPGEAAERLLGVLAARAATPRAASRQL